MGITTQTLMRERFTLQKTLNDLNAKIQTIEKEVGSMKNNMNAVHGALQQVEKLIQVDSEIGRKDGTEASVGRANGFEKPGPLAKPEAPNLEDGPTGALKNESPLDIKEKEQAQLLKEQEK